MTTKGKPPIGPSPVASDDLEAARARLYLDADLTPGRDVVLGPEHATYLRTVLRLKPGAALALFNARDGEVAAVLAGFAKGSATLSLVRTTRTPAPEPGPWLLFALVKRTRVDFIVEKATELGVERLVPVVTRRTQSNRTNLERLSMIAAEAAEQCERLTVPTIEAPEALERALSHLPPDRLLLVAAEAGPAQPLAEVMIPADTAVLIGPEGGFDPSELAMLADRPNTVLVGLGPRILRADTAALAALAIVQSRHAVARPVRAGPDDTAA
ncbi:MAG: 16S rRNA (uracil(1498)-N(3))-methyltransferase [Alphaproteobacteria bacterium]|nr:16S rRNA (uracil(1498)-N(3))-methyltransferase [Alphaproteobacteria bacterium]TAD89327.1 MAG: 16S rRNA (uracil(1498)-N(3))-methyltransferase [Alphaproteobacteria bacterium]